MTFKIEKGCVFGAFEAESNLIFAHQANTEGKMRSGVAREISIRYPEAVEADAKHHKQFGVIEALGTFSTAKIERDFSGRKWYGFIANVYGQTLQGDGRRTNYEALSRGLETLAAKVLARNEILKEKGLAQNKKIIFPAGIGAGLGGGDRDVVHAIIKAAFKQTDFEIVCWDKD